MKLDSANSRFLILALASALLFATATPVSKLLLRGLTAFQLARLLYIGAAIGVAPTLFRKERRLSLFKLDRKNTLRLLGAVACGGIAGPVLLLFGLQLASASSVSLWLNLELVATAMLGRLLFHDHLGKFGWFGVTGVVAAGILLSAGEGVAGLWAGLLVAGACACWGFDNHFTALIDGITPAQSTFWKGSVAGIVNLAIGAFADPFAASGFIVVSALVVGILAYGASITLYITAAQGMGATRAQMFFASAPFIGVALSALILGESITATQIVAAGILAISLGLLFRDQHQHAHEHEALSHEHTHRHDEGHHNHEHKDLDRSKRHSHWHDHEPVEHSHPHWPDLHHRHGH